MRKINIMLAIVTLVLFSCGKDSKSDSDTIVKRKEAPVITKEIENQKSVVKSKDKYVDTRYEYPATNGKNLIIKNSLPKGGLNYTDPDGREYIYAIFWSRIINETDSPFELTLEFPLDLFELPFSPDNYFKIVLSSEKMTPDKAALFNYGLTDLNAILDDKIQKASSIQRTIDSGETSSFYVVTLFKKGVEGAVRTGLSLKDGKLYYQVNDNEIYSGEYKIKNLELKK